MFRVIANKATKLFTETIKQDVRHFSTGSGQGNTGALCPTTDPKVLEALVEHNNVQKQSAQKLWENLSKENKNTFGKAFGESNVTSLQTTAPNTGISNPKGFSTSTKVASLG